LSVRVGQTDKLVDAAPRDVQTVREDGVLGFRIQSEDEDFIAALEEAQQVSSDEVLVVSRDGQVMWLSQMLIGYR
jgi:hypothetical protein